jgi:hypothetical protein
MYCLLIILLEEAVIDVQENLAPEEGQELDLPKRAPLCHEKFNEDKLNLPLMHKLPMLSTIT